MSVTYPDLNTEELVDKFNQIFLIGTNVMYWEHRRANPIAAKTRSFAWIMNSGEPVVKLSKGPGCYSLHHIAVPNGYIWYGKQIDN